MSDEKKELTDEEMEKTAGGYDGRVFGCDYINSEGQQCCCTFDVSSKLQKNQIEQE